MTTEAPKNKSELPPNVQELLAKARAGFAAIAAETVAAVEAAKEADTRDAAHPDTNPAGGAAGFLAGPDGAEQTIPTIETDPDNGTSAENLDYSTIDRGSVAAEFQARDYRRKIRGVLDGIQTWQRMRKAILKIQGGGNALRRALRDNTALKDLDHPQGTDEVWQRVMGYRSAFAERTQPDPDAEQQLERDYLNFFDLCVVGQGVLRRPQERGEEHEEERTEARYKEELALLQTKIERWQEIRNGVPRENRKDYDEKVRKAAGLRTMPGILQHLAWVAKQLREPGWEGPDSVKNWRMLNERMKKYSLLVETAEKLASEPGEGRAAGRRDAGPAARAEKLSPADWFDQLANTAEKIGALERKMAYWDKLVQEISARGGTDRLQELVAGFMSARIDETTTPRSWEAHDGSIRRWLGEVKEKPTGQDKYLRKNFLDYEEFVKAGMRLLAELKASRPAEPARADKPSGSQPPEAGTESASTAVAPGAAEATVGGGKERPFVLIPSSADIERKIGALNNPDFVLVYESQDGSLYRVHPRGDGSHWWLELPDGGKAQRLVTERQIASFLYTVGVAEHGKERISTSDRRFERGISPRTFFSSDAEARQWWEQRDKDWNERFARMNADLMHFDRMVDRIVRQGAIDQLTAALKASSAEDELFAKGDNMQVVRQRLGQALTVFAQNDRVLLDAKHADLCERLEQDFITLERITGIAQTLAEGANRGTSMRDATAPATRAAAAPANPTPKPEVKGEPQLESWADLGEAEQRKRIRELFAALGVWKQSFVSKMETALSDGMPDAAQQTAVISGLFPKALERALRGSELRMVIDEKLRARMSDERRKEVIGLLVNSAGKI